MTSEALIEKMAEAMCNLWGTLPEHIRDVWRDRARAALSVVRDHDKAAAHLEGFKSAVDFVREHDKSVHAQSTGAERSSIMTYVKASGEVGDVIYDGVCWRDPETWTPLALPREGAAQAEMGKGYPLKKVYGDGVTDDTEALQQRIDLGLSIEAEWSTDDRSAPAASREEEKQAAKDFRPFGRQHLEGPGVDAWRNRKDIDDTIPSLLSRLEDSRGLTTVKRD